MSSSSSSDGLSSSSSSSEDEAIAEVKIVDESEEEQLRMLREQWEVRRARRKALREAVREHGTEDLLQRARAHVAAQRRPKGRQRQRGRSNRGRRPGLSCQ